MKVLQTLFLAVLSLALFGQNNEKSIKPLLEKQYPANGPGGAILVSEKGKVIYSAGFGLANLENKMANTNQNVFMIGSITKQFTAVAILMLEEAGKLSVEDLVTKHLPDYPEHSITIRHLLNHTAGIPNYTDMTEWMAIMNEPKTPQEMMDLFKDLPLEFTPGTDWAYSNSGYIVLGAIIEKVSGESYESYLEQNIFAPLGMKSSYYGNDGETIKNMAVGYSPNAEGGFDNALDFSLTHPYAAGSIISTVGDQLIWISAIRDNKLISEASRKKAWTPCILPNGKNTHYGFGWMTNEIAGYPSIEHDGGIFGFVCSGVYIPEKDIFVSILTNRDGIGPGDIALKIAAAVAGKPYVLGKPLSLTQAEMDAYVAIYDFEDGTSRTVTRKGDTLFSQRNGSIKIALTPIAKDQFVFGSNAMSQVAFTRDNMNQIGGAVVKFRIIETKGTRTDKEIIEHEEITLTAAQLQRLEGNYELDPSFIISIDERDGRLFAQATGQPEFELYAESPLKFYLKVVDAQVDFVEAEDGTIEKMILHQGGQDMEGMRVK